MFKRSWNLLRRIANLPLHVMGVKLARVEMGRWRLRHAKQLGFSPRVIFDGGAFKGYWTREVASLFPGAKIVVIEPNPSMQAHIARSIAGIKPVPRVLNVALGQSPGRTTLNIWRDEQSDAGASLLNHVSGPARKTVEVTVQTLDGIAGEMSLMPDLVKLDLQGAELAALKGGANVLRHAEFMMIEFGCLEAYIERTTPRDLLEMMYDNDYCLYDVVDMHYRPYDGALTGGDFFFVKNTSILRSYRGWQ